MPRWLLHTLLTMILWGCWGALSKPIATSLSAWQVQALSTVGLLPAIGALCFSAHLREGNRPARGFAFAFAAGLVASAGNVAYYAALGAGGKVASVIPITSLYPLATIALALVFLGERISFTQLIGVAASLAALYLFNVGADTSWLSPWLALALIPIALWGVAALGQKLATHHASSELATLAFLLGFLPVALLTPAFQSVTLTHPTTTWLLLAALGLSFGLGNLTLIFAYGSGGKASVVTPMASLYSLITIPLAVAFLGEHIAAREWIGITLALAAIVALCQEPTPMPSKTPASNPND